MNSQVVHASAPILLVGGGETKQSALRAAIDDCETIVAADGGAAVLLAMGVMPTRVIGDMDSLDPALQERLPEGVLLRISEQDSTDFDKCLRHLDAPLVLAHGFLGGRLDHQLAVLTVLCRYPEKRCVLVGSEDVAVLLPPELTLDLPEKTRVSLYPLGPVSGTSTGLRWPIDGIEMAPDGRVGTSNEATGGAVRIAVEAPKMLLMLPVDCLPELVRALGAAEGWP